MTVVTMVWVQEHVHEVRNATKAVLSYLAFKAHYDDGTAAWPAIGTIAGACGLSEKTVQRSIDQLLDLGLLEPGQQTFSAINPKRPAAGRKRDRPERPGGSAALGVFEVRFRNDGHTTENISCNIMLQLIFCSVLNGRGQGKTRSHFRRGLLFCSSSGTWMSGDGDPTAGRSGKLTTGNIN